MKSLSDLMRYFTKANIRNVVIVMSLVFTFSFLIVISVHEIPVANKDLVTVLAPSLLGSLITGVVGYLFTQSKNPEKKSDSTE